MRILAYVIAVALLVTGSVWLADHPGHVTMEWLGWRVETSVAVLLVVLALLAGLLVAAFRVAFGLLTLPGRWTARRTEGRRRRGYQALSDGLAAAATGESERVRRLAGRAEKLLDDPALTGFLSARAAEMGGDADAARKHFQAMLGRPETEAAGLRGLLDQALKAGDSIAAIDLAGRARALQADDPWLAETLFTLLFKAGRHDEALILLADAQSAGALTRTGADHRRALALHQQARLATAEPRRAAALAKRALAADPALAPAAVTLAQLYGRLNKRRAAEAVLAKAWSTRPLPGLAKAMADLAPEEEPLARLARLEKLVSGRPNDALSYWTLGEAALRAKLWGQARKHLLAAVALRPSATLYRLLARLEEEGYKDMAAARSWIDKAAQAPADAAWQCRSCGAAAADWSATCRQCGAVDSLAWDSAAPSSAPLAPLASSGGKG